MPAPEQTTMSMAQRKRYIEVSEVARSNEPYKLHAKRNGMFLGSFRTLLDLEKYLLTIPETTLKPTRSNKAKAR